jgi:hypothetical protein
VRGRGRGRGGEDMLCAGGVRRAATATPSLSPNILPKPQPLPSAYPALLQATALLAPGMWVAGFAHLQRPYLCKEAHLVDRGDDGVEDLAFERSKNHGHVPYRKRHETRACTRPARGMSRAPTASGLGSRRTLADLALTHLKDLCHRDDKPVAARATALHLRAIARVCCDALNLGLGASRGC